jgi:hypothetical protein
MEGWRISQVPFPSPHRVNGERDEKIHKRKPLADHFQGFAPP